MPSPCKLKLAAIPVILTALVTLIAASGQAMAQSPEALAQSVGPIAGKWVGTFEFVALGESAAHGPGSALDAQTRGGNGESTDQEAVFGDGELVVNISNIFGGHFYGRWATGNQKAKFVCTMIDDRNFLCGGETASVLGILQSEKSLRMCWSFSGTNATSGCASLARPE